jgi:hypothetical protein
VRREWSQTQVTLLLVRVALNQMMLGRLRHTTESRQTFLVEERQRHRMEAIHQTGASGHRRRLTNRGDGVLHISRDWRILSRRLIEGSINGSSRRWVGPEAKTGHG